ncbi:hypothetical protein N802_08345 [Knoellia sinensis KCTC 19936]|uniref:DUF4178 domain-containing protein n=1 Tax=Knoellia sinensis KCTC 19936 TaxID=1385520 RepID=A0A0A0JDU1_9MICO|nr:DUF4178 domain-containing protein [Knoellia sinensis]KGN33806.1 hypothetical protein N802_08345 [Knoellia sinensis KCTC 19936]
MRTTVPLVDLEPGFVVHVAETSATVVGSVWLRQDGFVWSEHLLQGAGLGGQWLSVEDDEGQLTVRLWTPRPDLTVQVTQPDGRWMRVDGRRWTRREKGEAEYLTEGRTPYGPSGRCEYADYRHKDDRLSFERFGTLPWDVSTGRALPAAAVRAFREGDDAPRS